MLIENLANDIIQFQKIIIIDSEALVYKYLGYL